MILTNFMTYTPVDVIEKFFEKVQHSNMPALVEYLSTPQKAERIEDFKEIQGNLYFKVDNLWVKYGRTFRNPSELLSLNEKELEEHDQEELSRFIDYAEGRVKALAYIKRNIKSVPVIKLQRLYKTKRKWYFDRFGFRIDKEGYKESEPIKIISPSTPLKKDVIAELDWEKNKWLEFKEKLTNRIAAISKLTPVKPEAKTLITK